MRRTAATFRQVHLDFHTNEKIRDVGSAFNPEEFAATLQRAHVDAVLCFARCHHGWLYYDSRIHPERKHPHLARNLLYEQIEACHAHGIRVPIYTTVQWDNLTCEEHPEWRIVHADGRLEGTPPFEAGFYRKLCLNSPFREWFKTHTQDILDTFSVDGLYFDFIRTDDCCCTHCQTKMEAEGLDPADPAARNAFGLATVNQFEREVAEFVRAKDPECSITYNGGHIGLRHREQISAYTHFELETLPSGGWGYMYFPSTVRYARTLGPDVMGTTGKFHSTWGDFHSLKNRAALEFEVFRMLALGAKCSVADQLYPSGVLDTAAYELIGAVYSEVERKEPWCRGARPVTEIAVLHPEEFLGGEVHKLPPSFLGVTRMLEEGGHQFDVVDSAAAFERYAIIVLPDYIPASSELAARLRVHRAAGGSLIASFASGMDPTRSAFALDFLGVELMGEGPRDPQGRLVRGRAFDRNDYAEYLLPGAAIAGDLPRTEHVMYARGMDVEAAEHAEVLAETISTFFDRSWRHYTSHLQAPSSGRRTGAAIVRNGSSIYFAHPIFTQYERNAPHWCKLLFLNALRLLLPEPLVLHGGPSTMQATINEQQTEGTWVLHLLHYIPERRGTAFDTIEDVIPLHDVSVSVRVPSRVGAVHLVPEGAPLDFVESGERVDFVVPSVVGHEMVAIGFART